MNILGIGGYSHDSAAALVCDGNLVAAVAEERLTRVKHQGGVPTRAIDFCLQRAGLTRDDVDHIGVYMKPVTRVARRWAYRAGRMPAHPLYSAAYMGYELVHNAQYAHGMRQLRGKHARLHYMDHHAAHCASAFLVSPFDRAALLSIDYIGEMTSTWYGIGEGATMRRLGSIAYPHSLGVFYSAITDYLGFQRACDEYKVMGLASYGEPEYLDDFRTIVCDAGKGHYAIDLSWMAYHYRPGSREGYFSDKFLQRFGAKRRTGEPVEARHRNIAASAQRVLEETVLRLCEHLHSITGETALCLAGGVGLNCSMNGRLLRESPFDKIFVQPAAGDDGIAIGAAMQLHHELTEAPRRFEMKSAQLGPEYGNDAIREALDRAKLAYETPQNLEERAADLIAEGLIVGWYQGPMEFGPRALGGRSILADPTRPDMKDLINKYVKHREEFRPFAPSVLEERAPEFFDGCAHSPFMLFTFPVREDQRERLPAITHVDGSARVQTVNRETHPRFYRLIEAFEKRHGVPVVLNTSFNVMGEPIVNTPTDAIRCFYSTGLDALVIGDYVIKKSPARVDRG